MLRITKLTDYAIVVLAQLAEGSGGSGEEPVSTARALATRTSLPAPTVSKILKELAHSGLVTSQRGLTGGYRLSRSADEISVADIVRAVEGPIALTECNRHEPEPSCGYAGACPVEANWVRINDAIYQALTAITLADMARPMAPQLIRLTARRDTAPAQTPVENS
jgi:FeS assembly SUF system regulator